MVFGFIFTGKIQFHALIFILQLSKRYSEGLWVVELVDVGFNVLTLDLIDFILNLLIKVIIWTLFGLDFRCLDFDLDDLMKVFKISITSLVVAPREREALHGKQPKAKQCSVEHCVRAK